MPQCYALTARVRLRVHSLSTLEQVMVDERRPVSGLLKLEEEPQRSFVERLVRKLSPYRELITIVIFFAGGAFWLGTYFATKAQVAQLRCFARENIALNRAELKIRKTDEDLLEKGQRFDSLVALEKSGPLTEAQRLEKKRLEMQLKTLEASRIVSQTAVDSAYKNLLDSSCSLGDDR